MPRPALESPCALLTVQLEATVCDQDVFDAMTAYQLKSGALSRRQFGALAIGAGVLSLLPAVAAALEVIEAEVEIKTPDGTADAYFVYPAKGTHPGVLIWPDIFGLRPAFRQMGRRLAESGYAVLVVNPFYRQKKAPTAPEHPDFNDAATRAALMALMGCSPRRRHSRTLKRLLRGSTPRRGWTSKRRSARRVTAWAVR